jgi:hypothetical protein
MTAQSKRKMFASSPSSSLEEKPGNSSKNEDPFFFYNIAAVENATTFGSILD